MKIRRRDGTMAEVGDDYILQDGEAMTVALPFMDAKRMVDPRRPRPSRRAKTGFPVQRRE